MPITFLSNIQNSFIIDTFFTCYFSIRALKLLEVSDERLAAGVSGNLHLEEAFLYVLEQFRKTYVCEHIQKISLVYEVLKKNLGLQDENALLTVFVRKIITNLKFWWREERLFDATLALLNELSLGYSAARRIISLPDIQLLLNNHTGECFEFLSSIADLNAMHSRTMFYVSITRLMCVDFNDDESTFLSFMQPLSDNVRQICDVFAMSTTGVDQEQVKRAVIGLCRDIRGIAIACHMKSVYSMLFDWLYPNVFNIMLRSVELWADCSTVMSAVLKLLVELCQNRQQRLQFEMSSCSAVLLFREASKIICSFGERLLALPEVAPENAYKERYKHIASCFSALKMSLSGGYVPFGVFRLYGDTCLQEALSTFMKLFMAIPSQDFHSYQKVTQSFYSLLECVAFDNIAYLSNVQPELFITILKYIQEGAVSLDGPVVNASCATLDILLNYLYRRITQNTHPRVHVGSEPEGEECIRALEAHPTVLSETLVVMLDALLFDEVKCRWSMSRPLLGLILLQESAFQQWKMELIAQYPQEKRASFEEAFTGLMDGVDRNLSVRNKDIFTQNLVLFRKRMYEVIRGTSTPVIQPVQSTSDMMS
uniref:Importin-11 n=1 Tax=Syphacia muris TaxID=451379 RepID=A0A0N5ABI6_9BILA